MQAINRLLGNKDSVKETLAANIETALTEVDGIPIDKIDVRLEELQKELLKVANSKGNYDSITDEIYRLREMKQNTMADSAEREGLKLRIDEMRQFLDEQTESITEYDEKLTRRLIEKITVCSSRNCRISSIRSFKPSRSAESAIAFCFISRKR